MSIAIHTNLTYDNLSHSFIQPSSSPSIDQITTEPTPVVTVDSIAPTTNPLPDEPCDFSCTGIGGGTGEPFPNPNRIICSDIAGEECDLEFGDVTCQDVQNDLAEIDAADLGCRITSFVTLPYCCAEISSPSPTPDPFTQEPTNDELTLEPTNDELTPAPTDVLAPSNSPTIFSKSAKGAKSSGSKSSKSTTSKSSKAAAAVAPQSAFTMFKNWWN